jgi:hypothetical protein
VRRGRGYNIGPPSQIFKKLVNKIGIKVIKPKIGDSLKILPRKSRPLLIPPGILAKI